MDTSTKIRCESDPGGTIAALIRAFTDEHLAPDADNGDILIAVRNFLRTTAKRMEGLPLRENGLLLHARDQVKFCCQQLEITITPVMEGISHGSQSAD